MTIAIPENPSDPHVILNRYFGELEKDVAGGSNVVLTDTEAQYGALVFSGVLTASIDVVVPAENKAWDVHNATTGPYSLTVKKSGGTGVSVTQGDKVRLRYSTYAGDVVAWTAEL